MQLNVLCEDRVSTGLLTTGRRTMRYNGRPDCYVAVQPFHAIRTYLIGFDPAAKKQLLMRLKLISFIVLGFCLHLSAKSVSQTITFSGRKATLQEVFSVIEKQTGYVVFYDGAMLRKARPVTLKAEAMPLETFLSTVLKDQALDYSIQKRTIIISPKKIAPPFFTLPTEVSLPLLNIRGKVTNESGEPVSGATVTIRGTSRGTPTNNKGEFELEQVEEDAVLVISSVTYETKEIKVNGKSNLSIQVRTRVTALGDVTVSVNTGYQKIPKERATGSYTVITSKDLERRTAPNLLTLLEGMAPGLLISKSANGVEGEDDPSILMRGVSTFGNQQPLIVVDGFPIEGSLATINPNDVETVTLLRDAAAAAIWGVKATNGVIVIVTKKGKSVTPRITVRSSVNLNERPDLSYLRLMNAEQMVDYEKSRFYLNPASLPKRNTGAYVRDAYSDVFAILMDFEAGTITAAQRDARLGELSSYNNTSDASREFLNQQYSSDNTVSISAAPSDRFSYYASYGFLKGTGLYKSDDFQKSNVNFNTDIKLTNKLGVAVAANYTVNDESISPLKRFGASSNSTIPGNLKLLPYERLRNEDGSHRDIARRWSPEMQRKLINQGFMDLRYSPLDNLHDYDFKVKDNVLRLQATVTYQLHKSITLAVSYKSEKVDQVRSDLMSANAYETRNLINDFTTLQGTAPVFNVPKGSILKEERSTLNNYYIRGQVDINHTFNQDHRVDVTLGLERQKSILDLNLDTRFGYNPFSNLAFPINMLTLANVGIRNPITTLTNELMYEDYYRKSTLDDRYIFYYFAGSYSYKGKYTFSSSARINKSSRFDRSAGLNKQILASAGMKWDVLRENFMDQRPDWMNLLQVRYTAGLTGNVPDITTSSLRTTGYTYISLRTNSTYLAVNSPANKNLRWEPTLTHNLALDFSLFGNRVSGSVDLYHKKTTDLLGSDAIDPTVTGFYFVPLNSADITNRGLEIRLNTINVNAKKFRWQTTVNLGLNSNKVGFSTTNKNGVIGAPRNLTGYASRTFFALQWAGLNENGNGMVWDVQPDGRRVKVPSNTYQNLTFEDFKEIGTIIPKYTIGLSNIFQFGNWDFSFLFIANGGHKLRTDIISDSYFGNSFGASGFTNITATIANRWRKPGDEATTNVPRLNSFNSNQYNWSDISYQSADFIKLREVALSYLFDKKYFGSLPVNNIKVNFQVRNAWKWVANDLDIDPEAYKLTTGERTLPVTATYTFGILANF